MDLQQIEQHLLKIRPILTQAADIILNEDVSRYPIFIVNDEDIQVGIPVIEKEATPDAIWNINASTLEEFYVKKLIEAEKVDEFRKAYKSTDTHLCIFIVRDSGANFIFLPR
jgi:hypothetical protein